MTTKQITHEPEMKKKLKQLADARRVIADCEDAFDRDRKLLERCRKKMTCIQREIGPLMISLSGWETGRADTNDKQAISLNAFLKDVIDDINRLLG